MISMEIERKWLVDIKDVPYDLSKYESLDIFQAYINFSPTIRIRKITNKNLYILTMKSKSTNSGLSRNEYEINISEEEYNDLLNKKEGIVLHKTRYRINEKNLMYEIDIFHDEYEGLCYLEVEFSTEEEALLFKAPEWVKEELTGNHKYSNASLAKGLK